MTFFSKHFRTFEEWRRAQPQRTSYVMDIERGHVRYPRAKLSQLRRHPRSRQKALSALHARESSPTLGAMTVKEQADYERSLMAVNLMRRQGLSLSAAARQAGTMPRTVTKYAHGGLIVGPDGIKARLRDRLVRPLTFYDDRSVIVVEVNSSRTATLIAEYHNAVGRYVNTGDATALGRFSGRSVTDAQGVHHLFVTDLDTLDFLARTSEIRFESIYQFVSPMD